MNSKSINEVNGKVAIVTGAASGIGRAPVELLHARGARVIAEGIIPFVGDVATEGAAKSVMALAVERFGKLDILINNAATIIYKRADEMTLEEWNRIIAVNLTGVFLHSCEAVRAMKP